MKRGYRSQYSSASMPRCLQTSQHLEFYLFIQGKGMKNLGSTIKFIECLRGSNSIQRVRPPGLRYIQLSNERCEWKVKLHLRLHPWTCHEMRSGNLSLNRTGGKYKRGGRHGVAFLDFDSRIPRKERGELAPRDRASWFPNPHHRRMTPTKCRLIVGEIVRWYVVYRKD